MNLKGERVLKKWTYLFWTIAVILSDIMCFFVAYNYRGMLCAEEHQGFSAPAETAFLLAVPFVIGIIVCVILGVKFRRK